MNNNLDLAQTHVTQLTHGHVKSEWSVNLNGTQTTIHTFPSHFTENEIFAIMDFAKKYELEAFNKGLQSGKEQTTNVYKPKLAQKEFMLDIMQNENSRLAEALDAEQQKDL